MKSIHMMKQGKEVFAGILTSGKTPEEIVKEKGLQQISNTDEIIKIANKFFPHGKVWIEKDLQGKDRFVFIYNK